MRYSTIAVIIFALLASPACAQDTNPVTNGGFEELGDNGLPVDWSILGDVTVSDDAHSGSNAALIRRERVEDEAGLNRGWIPDSGEQGTMLAQLRGAIRFWYKAVSGSEGAAMHFFVIAMSERPFEDTGEMRADFVIPTSHIGDGEWHMGLIAYDFTDNPDVKWIHLSPRITGREAALLLDDIEWLEKAGPVLAIAGTRWQEDEKRPGERATLAVRVKNTGDERTSDALVRVTCPDYLRVAGEAEAALPRLPPEQYAEVSFVIEGRRDRADVIAVSAEQADAGAPPAAVDFRIEPEMEVIQLRPNRFILSPGQTTVVEAVVRGAGNAICTGIVGELEAGDSVAIVGQPGAPAEAAPGREAVVAWKVKALRQTTSASLAAAVSSKNAGEGSASTTLVVGAKPRKAPDRPGAHVEGDVAWLQGEGVRIALQRSEFGFGIADLQVKERGWQTVARVPSAGRIVLSPDDGEDQHIALYGSARAEGEKLVIESSAIDPDGAKWEASVTFALREEGRNIGVTSSLRCDRTRKLLAFGAPMLYVGEGGFGAAKDEALFPGLDWLDTDDVSSEDEGKVIQKGHPHQVRYVPHPNMITIPLMSVHKDGTTVGLLWDCRRKWDGLHDRPAAVFASPDRFEGRNAHSMGLFVPSVAEEGKPWVKPNERIAWTPYDLPAGREISIESVIYTRTDTPDALSAMDEWFRIYGVPEPPPYPQGSVEAQVAFHMQAYLHSMWVADEQMWWNTRGAGKLLSQKTRPMSFVHELLTGALIIDDPLLQERCRARAEEVMALTGGRPKFTDDGFDYGAPDEHLIGVGGTAMSRISSQGRDGSWRFDADRKDQGVFKGRDYHDLGPDNAAELGTCAANAYTLLRFARLTGEHRAYEAGVKALRFMERFRVPRAAQVWEVQVHAPDILAAADAVDAYLAAYRYDGRQEWLDEAVRWARGGLPFVYMWDDPEIPFVLGASIPVFGASWEIHSWYGRPVQWNGLRHARAMLKLARYDDSMPWEQLAELIIVSAMYQESTDDDDIALWPDSASAIDGSKVSWLFSPLAISEAYYMLIGRQGEPDTAILGERPERIHLSSGAEIRKAAWEGERIAATLRYPDGESGYTLLVGVSPPLEVLLDGEALPESDALEAGDAPGWRYNTASAMCVIRITEDGEHELELLGVGYQDAVMLPEPRNRLGFEFEKGTEGWVPANHLAPLGVKDGALQAPVTGGDPYMLRTLMSVDGDSVDELVIRMRTPAGVGAQLYWGTAAAPGFTEERVISFPVTGDGAWHEYRIPVGEREAWKGHRITGLRLDPLSPGEEVTVEIDWIRGE